MATEQTSLGEEIPVDFDEIGEIGVSIGLEFQFRRSRGLVPD